MIVSPGPKRFGELKIRKPSSKKYWGMPSQRILISTLGCLILFQRQ